MSEFVISWEMDETSSLTTTNRWSPTFTYLDLPWNIMTCKRSTNGVEYFSLYLKCNDDCIYDHWSVEHDSQLVVVNRNNAANNIDTRINNAFCKANDGWGKHEMMRIDHLLDTQRGFILNDKILLEARVSVKLVQGVKKVIPYNFTREVKDIPRLHISVPRIAKWIFRFDNWAVSWAQSLNLLRLWLIRHLKTTLLIKGTNSSIEPSHDTKTIGPDSVVLTIGGENIHVSRGFLSVESPFFADLLSNGKMEFELKDVTAHDFNELLHATYPTNKPIIADTFKPILELAERFQVQRAIDKVEEYLSKTKKLTLSAKLVLSEKHRLHMLQLHCIHSLQNKEAVKNLEKAEDYKYFSNDLKIALLSHLNFERFTGMPDEFVYRWEVDNVSKLTFRARRSPIFFHCDIPWTIEVRAENSNRTNNIKNFCYYLFCNDDDDCDLWNVDTRATLSLIHRRDPEKNEVCEIDDPMNKEELFHWGICDVIAFETLLKPTEGFIKDDSVIVEARIFSADATFVRNRNPEHNFSQPSPNIENVALKFDNGTIHVCRKFLMWHSPYFANLLHGDKMRQGEMLLLDVKIEDFTELLSTIFPPAKPINAHTYKSVLSLAVRFKIEKAVELAEQYLIKTLNLGDAEKLLIAEQYKLVLLREHCFNSLENLAEMKEMEEEEEFVQLPASMKAALLNKAFELIT